MLFEDFFRPPVWSVSDLTRYLKDLVTSDPALQELWVQGEVSNFKVASSGHAYFTLKDGRAQLPCVMWRPQVQRQQRHFLPRDGDAVEAHGFVGVYEAGGRYQFYADLLKPAGEGALYREFQRLKARLEAEGLFDESRKRPLPRFPRRIGVVTSATGAALRDILNTLRRRYPLAEVILAPAVVQGEHAPPTLVAALQSLYAHHPDLVILARGGGSMEDLWAFNDERVVRAVAAAPVPVITGVGHQTDFTLVDFAADQRAPTPTAAAEMAVPHQDDLRLALRGLETRLQRAMVQDLTARRATLTRMELRLHRQAPLHRVFSQAQRLDELERRLHTAAQHLLALHQRRVQALSQRLAALNPLAILRRGYALLTTAEGQVVRSAAAVHPGQRLHARLAEGGLKVVVEEASRDWG